MKKYRKYIIQMSVYIMVIIIAITAAIVIPKQMELHVNKNLEPTIANIKSEIQSSGSDLDRCKEQINELYGYADEDSISDVLTVYQEETNYRQIKEWISGKESWNNGRILVGLCKYPIYKDSYELLTKVFNNTKKTKGSSNIDPYKIIYDAAESHYSNKDYIDAVALYSILGDYKDTRNKFNKSLQEISNSKNTNES
nr:MAG TPA: hypothetical protein [Caudoviricetes sp.]